MKNKKLYAVMLGGRSEGCHIELHDLVFVVGCSLEETYPRLVDKWFGSAKNVHIDSSIELSIVDGYKVSLLTELPSVSSENKKLLYCVNFGGYKQGVFGELHEFNFYVGKNKKEIIKRAKNELCVNFIQQHCDDNLVVGGTNTNRSIDDLIEVGSVDNYYVQLTPTNTSSNLKIKSSYRRLRR